MIIDIITCIALILGSFLIFLGAVGLLRLPDFYCRAHALTKAMTMGISLVLVASWIDLGIDFIGYKILLAIILQFSTIPISGHILGLIAFEMNEPRWQQKEIDIYPNQNRN
jgi:multicomponent Na+:H+ antiporter subunit G